MRCIQRQIEFQNVNARFAQNAELTSLSVFYYELAVSLLFLTAIALL